MAEAVIDDIFIHSSSTEPPTMELLDY